MPFENLLYEKREGIAYITFNRPKVLNALNRKTIEELHQVLVDARGDASVRVLILTGAGEKAFVAGADINELAQAKGANVAGLQVVFQQYGLRFDEVDLFYLAGGFGRHLNIDAATRIGLIPSIPPGRLLQIGNAAIEGATIALLSRAKRAELEHLVRRVEHCRLETHPQFFDFFVDGCLLQPVQTVHGVVS